MVAASSTSTEVFILGAGFSKSVSDKLLLTNELGEECLKMAGLDGKPGVPKGPFTGGSFEAWLSRIAEDQPYLDTVSNAENRTRFLAVRNAIHERLTRATQEALAEGWKPWLPAFLRLAHDSRATVITFNYDTILECAIDSNAVLADPGQSLSVSSFTVTGGLPPKPPLPGLSGMTYGNPPTSGSFRLLKLHGSLNWYGIDGDTTGISMLTGPTPGLFNDPKSIDSDYLRQFLPAREPFVVPPATSKSSYFRNPLVRQIWQDAHTALRAADRVTFIGYSLPLEDGTFSGLLTEALGGRPDVRIDIADYYPPNVQEHLRAIGLDALVDRIHAGGTAAADLVATRLNEAAGPLCRSLAASLNEYDPDTGAEVGECRLMVRFDRELTAIVRSVDVTADIVTLSCDPPVTGGVEKSREAVSRDPDLVNGHELEGHLPGAIRVEALSDGLRHVVLRYDVDLDTPDGPWLTLDTATTPRTGAAT